MKTLLHYILFILLVAVFPFGLSAQDTVQIPAQIKYSVFRNVQYGTDIRTTFDLFLPDSDKEKMPLVVYFHGGSFLHGDKSKIKDQLPLAADLLDQGIAFASVNYRYRQDDDSLGVQRCLNDAVHFIQFIRLHASEYRIDPNHIGCYGESAGAGISLFLAFHDDLAVPGSDDPLARETTRIACAGAVATQSTYNMFRWKRIIPGYWLVFPLKRKALNKEIANFYGFKSFKEFRLFKKEISSKLDLLKMVSPDDPPVWLCNMVNDKIKKGIPHNENQLFHHPAHAVAVGKKAHKAGIVHYVITDEKEKKQSPPLDDFFEKYLNAD